MKPAQPLTLDAISAEVARARIKFPSQSRETIYIALCEEVGELAKAILERADEDHLQLEAIQVAAMAVRFIEECGL